MMVRWLVWLVPLLLLAMPALAGWDSDEDGTGTGCEVEQPNPTRQRRCWYNYTGTGTGSSNMLTIEQCENFSVEFETDWDGTATAGTGQFMVCLDDTNTNSCAPLKGVTFTSSFRVVYGADGTWAYWLIGTACGTGNNCRVEFRCNQ
ncbi:MAG: hypothetical protein ACYTBJ_12530 [Planctomycetota bacterium]|jgi:hypothetical protein